MLMKTADAAPAGHLDWWALDAEPGTASHRLDVSVARLLDLGWCSLQRVSLGPQPHEVRFCRDAHSLLIFDHASFVEGGRWADGHRLSASGPLDVGVDLVPAGSEFRGWAGPGSQVGCTMLSIDRKVAHDMMGEGGDTAVQLHAATGIESDLLLPLTERLRQLGSAEEAGTADRLYTESICTLLFREVLKTQGQQRSRSRPTGGLSTRAQRLVRDYMHEHQDQKIELKTLSDLAGVSRFHFTRAFKVSFGLPPYKYLTHLRLRRAGERLRQSNDPITEIALAVGFSCSSEFARAFKQGIGCTPREFRQTHRQ